MHIDFVRRQALIRELFYLEIRNKAIPKGIKINTAFEKSIQRITISTLFTQEEDISNEWRSFISTGKTFEEIAAKYERNAFVEESVSSFHWGDGNIPLKIQIISYRTKVGGISEVFEVPQGFGILKVRNRLEDVFLTSYNRHRKKQEVSKIIQARNENLLAGKYVEQLLGPIKVEQLALGFKEIKGYLENRAYLKENEAAPRRDIRDIELKKVDKYDLSIMVIKTPDFEWDGNDIIYLLKQYNFPIDAQGIESIGKSLHLFIKGAVRDYYLEKRAVQLGLESNVRVMNDIQMWRRYYLYLMGINELIIEDSTKSSGEIIREEIRKKRAKANIVINPEVIKTIRITGIPMLVLWNSEFSRNLAVPPLVGF